MDGATEDESFKDFISCPSPSFSPSFGTDEKSLPTLPSHPAALTLPNDLILADDPSDFSPEMTLPSLLDDASSNHSPLSASSLSTTPVVDGSSTSSAVGLIDNVGAGFDLGSFLAAPMYDDADDDATTWNPLFNVAPPATVSSVLPVKVGVKREAEEEDNVVVDAPLAMKRFKQDATTTNLAVSKPVVSPVSVVSTAHSMSSPEAAVVYNAVATTGGAVDGDSAEAKAMRRARNTAAARRSRDKKRERMTELEAKVAELERLNTQLSIENQFLRTLKSMPPRS